MKYYSLIITVLIVLIGYNYTSQYFEIIDYKAKLTKAVFNQNQSDQVKVDLLSELSYKDSIIKLLKVKVNIPSDTIIKRIMIPLKQNESLDTLIEKSDSTYSLFIHARYKNNLFEISNKVVIKSIEQSFELFLDKKDNIIKLDNNIARITLNHDLYDQIYSEYILSSNKKNNRWYNYITVGIGVSYTWRGEVLPCVYLGVGLNWQLLESLF